MKKTEILKTYGPAVLSAILMALAFPPANVSLLVLVALAPWLASLREFTPKQARRSGYVFGVVLFSFQMFWVYLFAYRWLGDVGKGLAPWLVAALLAGFYFLFAGWLINRCWKRGLWWLIPFVWAGIEAFRAYIPGLAFPWSNLANPLWLYPAYVQHAALGTMFLVSAWLIIPNLLVGEWLFPPKDESLRFPGSTLYRTIIVFLAFLGVSLVRFSQEPAGQRRVFTIGQTGVDMAFSEDRERKAGNWAALAELERAAVDQGADLLVLPESVAASVGDDPPITPMGPRPHVPVLMGTFRSEGTVSYQSAYVFDEEDGWKFGDKTRLVIFGEFVPMRQYFPFLQSFNLAAEDLRAGTELKTPEVNGMKAGPMLCFEGLFPDLADRHGRQGAQFLAVMSIDDWYYNTPAWDQLWQSTVWRSIESGLPLIRAGTNGKSLATDSRGRIITQAEPRQRQAIRTEISVPEKSDAFAYRMGFVYLCWAVVVFLCLPPVSLPKLNKAKG